MGAFDTPSLSTKSDRVPPTPAECRCGAPTIVALMVVRDTNGRTIRAPASAFVGRDNHGAPDWVLQERYSYSHYDAYCAQCWFDSLELKAPRKYTDKQVSVAWKWFMGEVSKTEDTPALYEQPNLTDEQKDTAIEIVNYEAWRTNQPDAIPNDYKLPEIWS